MGVEVDIMLTQRIELEILTQWLRAKRLTLNVAKTKFMLFATRPKISELENFALYMDGVELEWVQVFKYLGMYLDVCLTFDEHVDHLHKKSSQRVGVIRHYRKYLNQQTTLLLYKGFGLTSFWLWKYRILCDIENPS